jgi:4-hydroxy-tetrahydrodipicolinate synthase
MLITGVVSVLPTPFRAGGDVDHPSLARLVDAVVAAGVQAVSVLGPAGETSRMTERERLAVVDTVTSHAAGRLPVFVDTSSDGVRTCLEFSRQVKTLGAAAAVISPPRAQRLSVESVVNHYRAVAEALDLRIVVQDAPTQCGVTMDAGLLLRIAREVPAARTIRLEDPPTSVKIARILAAAGETRVGVLGGQGGLFLIEDLLAGAAGVATAFAYPETIAQVVTLFRADRIDDATDTFHRVVPLMRFENQEGIGTAVRKEMWRRRGVFADASTRAPGFVLDEGTRAAVDRLIARVTAREGLTF